MVYLALLCIFLGEVLAIWAEILYTKGYKFHIMLIPMILSGVLLLLWYKYWYAHIKNIWVIYVVSITTILIAEPLIISLLTNEWWTLGAKIGFILWVAWLLATMIIK